MPRTNAPHNEASKLSAMDNRAKALDLRRAGASLRDIAKALGVSHQSAKRYIDAAIADLHDSQNQKTEDYRAVEIDRLERLHMSLWQKALGGKRDGVEVPPDYAAVDRLIRISERRSKLLGLDASAAVKVSGDPDAPLTIRLVDETEGDNA